VPVSGGRGINLHKVAVVLKRFICGLGQGSSGPTPGRKPLVVPENRIFEIRFKRVPECLPAAFLKTAEQIFLDINSAIGKG